MPLSLAVADPRSGWIWVENHQHGYAGWGSVMAGSFFFSFLGCRSGRGGWSHVFRHLSGTAVHASGFRGVSITGATGDVWVGVGSVLELAARARVKFFIIYFSRIGYALYHSKKDTAP